MCERERGVLTQPLPLSPSVTPPPGTQGRRISLGMPMHPPEGEITSLQKHLEKLVPLDAARSLGIGMGVWGYG